MPTRRTRGIKRAKVGPGIIDKVKNAFNKPKTQQVQHKTPEQKVTTRQVAHKMPEADKFPDKTTKSTPTTTKVPITRNITSTPSVTTAPPAMSRNQYRDNFRNDATALMNAKRASDRQPQHLRNYLTGDLGEGLDNIDVVQIPGTTGQSRRDFNIIRTYDDGTADAAVNWGRFDDEGVLDTLNKNFTRYKDNVFIGTDPTYQQFRTNYGRRDNQGQTENYINYNPNTNKFSLFDYSEGEPTDYFDSVDDLLNAGSKMSYRRNQ